MSSDENDVVWIERWLDGDLDADEAREFTQRMETDDAFAARVEAAKTQGALGVEMRAALRGAMSHDPSTPSLPDHEIVSELARGGQGVVYRARQLSTGRDVALKVLLHGARDAGDRARFEREIDLAASLSHPHIVKVFDRGLTDDGRAYVVMELVDGQPIDITLDAQGVSLSEKLELFDRVCAAVAYAHRNGVIHRDLKPANILVDGEGEPRLLDFGLAHATDSERTELTQPGTFLGTLAYAAPEQLDEDNPRVDARADVYGLGVVLYRILTGAHPFPTTGSIGSVIRHVLETEPAAPSRSVIELDRDLDALVLACLEKDPAARYATVEALRDDIGRWLKREPLAVRSHHRGYLLAKTLRRHRTALAAAGVVMVALIVATVVSTTALGDAQRQAGRATRLNNFLVNSIADAVPGYSPRDRTVVEWIESVAAAVDEAFADDPESAATIHTAIASVFRVAGNFENAERHAREAIAAVSAVAGPTSREGLIARRLLAEAVQEQGQLKVAEELFDELVVDAKATLPSDDMDGAAILRARAGLDIVARRWDDAVAEMTDLLAALMPSHAPTSQAVLSTRHTLALAQERTAPEEALVTWTDLVTIYDDVLGPDHGKTLGARTNRANLLIGLGRIDEARHAWDDLVERQTRSLGPDNPGTLQSELSRAMLVMRSGDSGAAVEAFVGIVERAREHLGERNSVTLQALQGLGISLRLAGQPSSAAGILEQALEGRLATVGPDHEASIQLAIELAITSRASGDLERTVELLGDALPRAERVLGRLDQASTSALFIHGLALIDLERFEAGIAALDDLIARTREVEGPNSWRAWRYVAQRGHAERGAGNTDAAAVSFEQAWAGLSETIGATSSHARNAAQRRADLADSLGRPEVASLWKERAHPKSP